MPLIQFWGPLVPSCTGDVLSNATGEQMCTFCDALTLLDNVVKFMATLAPVIATAFIIWGAFLIITAGGSSERLKSGRTTIIRAVVGLAIVLAAWLIVSTIFLLISGSYEGPFPVPWYRITC